MKQLFSGESNVDFIGRIPLFSLVSSLAVIGSIVATAVMGLNFGIDFAGGYEIQVKFPTGTEVNDSRIKDIVAPVVGDARVQRFGEEEDNEFLILVREHGTLSELDKSNLKVAFAQAAGGPDNVIVWSVAESGESLKIGFDVAITEEQVRATLGQFPVTISSITHGDRADQPVFVVTLFSLADQIEVALRDSLAIAKEFDIKQRVEFVGPQVGAELRNQGIQAVLLALFFILLYIAIRFDFFFAPGAVIALAHDVAITIGVFAILQLEFNLPIIAAILAIVGYSLNDTIVVYDRIRENVVRLRGRDLRSMVNTSLNQTISRTVLTSLTTLLVVAALLVFGGGIIRDFSIALLIGIAVGTYSSLAIATPAYVLLRERYGKAADSRGGTVAAA